MDYEYTGYAHHELVAAYDEDEAPFPTGEALSFPDQTHRRAEIALLKQIFFPRCWNAGELLDDPDTVKDRLTELGSICVAGIRPYVDDDPTDAVDCLLDTLPAIRSALKKDIDAAYRGDPAARNHLEIIRSYPGFHAIMVQRVAHVLYDCGAGEYARELTEAAKSETGIDIHPGAEIGESFFIDHGTGVVVGETTTIGDYVRIYQNVTLGALHFEEQEGDEYMLKKGYKRHPDIGDHVVIGAGSNILGPITIGDHTNIGANTWVTEDIPAHTTVVISEHPDEQERWSNDNDSVSDEASSGDSDASSSDDDHGSAEDDR